jgi:hypothetical protein
MHRLTIAVTVTTFIGSIGNATGYSFYPGKNLEALVLVL